MKLLVLKCKRCSHEWAARHGRKREDVKICPKCKSPYWDKEKRTKQ